MIIEKICNKFNIKGELLNISSYGEGHINDTYLIETNFKKYIIQKINNKVFKKPDKLMKNFYMITKWMEKNNDNYRGIKLVETKKGKIYFKKDDKYYRCYEYIENCDSYNEIDDMDVVFEMGKALGEFDKTLEDFPINKLYNIVPNFHNSLERYKIFKEKVNKDEFKLKNNVLKEIFFIYKRKHYFNIINDELNNNTLRLLPIHNDPKINNILIDKNTKKQICLIDLDTVMPGTILFDFGDAIRSIILNCKEDEFNLNNVSINIDKFYYFSKGFFSILNSSLTLKELELLVDATIIITLECGMRFLTDYLDGNKYFKVDDTNQNLRRAKVALKEVELLEKNSNKLKEIIKKITSPNV